jgi:adenylyltransferase/sulfurtransferase
VLGVLPGVIGSLQAAEAIKWIVGAGTSLVGRLLHFDALTMRSHEMTFARDPNCSACGADAPRTLLPDYEAFCGTSSTAGSQMTDESIELTPTEVQARMAAGWRPWLLDVREPWEFSTAHLDGATLMPLGDLAQRAQDVPRDVDVVAYCHHGMRSARAVSILRLAGWTNVFNLTGGIDRWSTEVDLTMPRY